MSVELSADATVVARLYDQHEAIRAALPPAVLDWVEREIYSRSMISFGGEVRRGRLISALRREAVALERGAPDPGPAA